MVAWSTSGYSFFLFIGLSLLRTNASLGLSWLFAASPRPTLATLVSFINRGVPDKPKYLIILNISLKVLDCSSLRQFTSCGSWATDRILPCVNSSISRCSSSSLAFSYQSSVASTVSSSPCRDKLLMKTLLWSRRIID